MQTVLHYLELRLFFNHMTMRTPFPVTIEKLTGIWHCTPRYTKLIVRKLTELGWVDWKAGKGRGNTSMLTLRTESADILLQEVKSKMEQGHVKEAMELMNRFGNEAAKDQFMDWLSEGMGVTTQTISNTMQDTLRLPVYRTIVTLDPGLVYYAFDAHMVGQLFNTLVEFDAESRTVLPCIAHSWESSNVAQEWTFHLKKGVMFHHGRELTAHDVVFSIHRLRSSPDLYESSWMFRDIEQLEILDQRTVKIRLKEPNYLFLRFLCATASSIVPEDIVRKNDVDFAKAPIGTGPFRLVRLSDGICVLEAFPQHFRGRPHLDRVEVLIFPEKESGRLKEPDWTSVMSSNGDTSQSKREFIASNNDEWCDVETLFSCCSLLVFNRRKPGPQNHPLFRKALHHILDRNQMIADLGDDLIYPAVGLLPHLLLDDQTTVATKTEPTLERDEIMALLQASGYSGETFRLATNVSHEAEAAWIKERCSLFGIRIESYVKYEDIYGKDHPSLQEHDGRLFGVVPRNNEVRELEMYAQNNYFLPAFDEQTEKTVTEIMNAIFREPDEKERQKKLVMLEDLLRQTLAVLFLVHKKSNTAFHKSVRGVSINAYGWLDFYKIWFHTHVNKSSQ